MGDEMMRGEYCEICGATERVKFYPSKRLYLCPGCAERTPSKVSLGEFRERVWKKMPEMPIADVREFYDDYLKGDKTLGEYLKEAGIE